MAKQTEELQLWQTVAPVDFSPRLPDRNEAQALLITVRQGPGYPVAGGQLAHAITSRADQILLDFSAAACAIRYQVDGNWEQLPPLDRETGDAMLYSVKQLCQMNPADRRSPQSGKLGMKLAKAKYELQIQSQGVKSGERVLARIVPEKSPFTLLADLGMRDKMIATFKEQLNTEGNIVIVSAPKGQGLTTTWEVAINAADRFIRDFQSFEPQGSPEPDIINVNPNFFGGDTGLTETQIVRKIVMKEPDVLMFPSLPEEETMEVATGQVAKANKQIITRLVADSALEAIVQVLAKYKESASSIASQVGCVLNQRLVRRLCDSCKLGFEPPPKLLQQLGIPPGRVAQLYKPFIPPPPEQQVDENGRPAPITPCPVCGARGYYGRVAIFELLCPGEKLKDALTKTRDVSKLAAVTKAEGFRNVKAEAVLTVARGLTSLDELKRLFAGK